MNTYFIVVASADRPEFHKEFGPYLCYEDAAVLMVDHLRGILHVELKEELGEYTAQIIEVCYTHTSRIDLVVKTTEKVIIL